MGESDSRYALGVEYLGTSFHGWQRQVSGLPTVQGILEDALSDIADHSITLICAGRTDRGVHAIGQVVHFDCRVSRPTDAFVRGANTLLPAGIRVRWAKLMSPRFHARFSAEARHYRYIICNYPVEPALLRWGMTWWRDSLDASLMQEAAQHWLGEHDFSAFRASTCNSHSPIRCIESITVSRVGVHIVIDVIANGFLLHMVRNLAGTLRLIGDGRHPPDWARQLLVSKDRTKAGATAPPDGLYLMSVRYPQQFELPIPTLQPAFFFMHPAPSF